MVLYRPARRRGPSTEVPEMPQDRPRRRAARVGWSAAAVLLPVLTSLVMVPIRDDIDRSTAALVLVLPVLFVAVHGGRLPAGVAAIVAPLSFDVLLTRPYQRLEIAVAADVEAALILLVVGLTVAVVASDASRASIVASARGREVGALDAIIGASAGSVSEDELVERTCLALTELLDLRSCRWRPGYRGAAYPVLDVTGDVSGPGRRDRAPLPATGVEIPVRGGGRELGRLVAVPSTDRPVSREERAVASAVAQLFGRALSRRSSG